MTGKEFIGKVVSNRMHKSVLVAVDRLVRNYKYGRVLRRSTKLMAHDENNECNIGDTVRIHICRPLSKRKCWTVTDILHRAKVFDAESAAAAARAAAEEHAAAAAAARAQQHVQAAPSFAASGVTEQP
eukprot:scaffold8.g1475.t1